MRCTTCYLLVAALLLTALLVGNPLPRREVAAAGGVVPMQVAVVEPHCPDPALAPEVVRHEIRDGRHVWWLRDGGAVVVQEGLAVRLAAGVDPLGPAPDAHPTATGAVPAEAVHAAAPGAAEAAAVGHDPR
ncbi:MAG: hypothetical protein RL148_3075 [Planctomycetota bacterium]|jgi:hypothetical protein